MSTRSVTPPVAAPQPPPRPSNGGTVADGAVTVGGTFMYNAARRGWEIPAAVRSAQNLPNLILANASTSEANSFERLVNNGTDFRLILFLEAQSVRQPVPYAERSDTAGTTILDYGDSALRLR